MKIVNNLMGQGAKQICTRGFEIQCVHEKAGPKIKATKTS